MKKSTALFVIVLVTIASFFIDKENIIDKIIYKLTVPIYVVGYFIVKQLKENKK